MHWKGLVPPLPSNEESPPSPIPAPKVRALTKRCTKCWQLFPATREHFYAQAGWESAYRYWPMTPTEPVPLRSWCQECRLAYSAAYQKMWPAVHRRSSRANKRGNPVIRRIAMDAGVFTPGRPGLYRCPQCKEEKPQTPEYFHQHLGESNGLNSWCKACANARRRKQAA